MNADVQALLALQGEDAELRALSKRRRALEPRLLDLERRRQVALDALDRARKAAEGEERRMRDVEHRVAEHRHLHERNVAQLEQVRRSREASAAVSQVEQARRILADEEGELQSHHRRLADLRQAVVLHEQALAEAEREQEESRREIDAQIAEIDGELRQVRERRDGVAALVPPPLLSRYERISARRKDDALYPLRGASCASCDTALPLQRRSMMARTGAIEVCEACGVLLYATE